MAKIPCYLFKSKDITMKKSDDQSGLTYKDAGVDIVAGEALSKTARSIARETRRNEVIGDIGGFGALFSLPKGYEEPVLVSGTDGVGTKLRLALELGIHRTIGIDLVAMCVNDIIVAGAEPLFFLDYYATGKLNLEIAAEVLRGIGEGCQLAGCSLIGGETAEMPGIYDDSDYDLAGFAVGIVEKSKLIDGSNVKAGNVLIGLPSSGAHSNGYSLIRKIVDLRGADMKQNIGDLSLGEALLKPTQIYVKPILELKKAVSINAMCHITGGGIIENLPRVLPDHYCALIEKNSWEWPPIFNWLRSAGKIETLEMYRTFNCGVGMILCVDYTDADITLEILKQHHLEGWKMGEIREGPHRVQLRP